jgi:hypothetical protein
MHGISKNIQERHKLEHICVDGKKVLKLITKK